MNETDFETADEIKKVISSKKMDEGYKALFIAFLDEYSSLQKKNLALLHKTKEEEDRDEIAYARTRERIKANTEFQNFIFDTLLSSIRESKSE